MGACELARRQAQVLAREVRREAFGAHFAGSKSGGKYLLRTLRSPCREEMHQTIRRHVYIAGADASNVHDIPTRAEMWLTILLGCL